MKIDITKIIPEDFGGKTSEIEQAMTNFANEKGFDAIFDMLKNFSVAKLIDLQDRESFKTDYIFGVIDAIEQTKELFIKYKKEQ